MKLNIFLTAPLGAKAMAKLQKLGEVTAEPWITEKKIHILGPDELAEKLRKTDAHILICEADLVSGPVFETGLKLIASCRGEPTNVDIEGATKAGIPVVNTPGRNADAVAELTIGLLLGLTRHFLSADREVRAEKIFSKTIPYQRHRAHEIKGRIFGIVGLGSVGQAVKWRAEALGMRVLACDPYNPEAESTLEELLKNADYISMHAPALPETLHLMNAREFALCKKGAYYINTARASLHNLDALTEALSSGHLAGAALDHFEGESISKNHPLVKMENVILTPHIGGATYETEERQGQMIVKDIQLLMKSEMPKNIVNPEVLLETLNSRSESASDTSTADSTENQR